MTTPTRVPRKWAWHHETLVRLRERLLRERNERDAAAREAMERGGADLADAATVECEHGELLAQLSQEDAELAEVEAAIDRIYRGTYGICEMTGEPIAPERLRAIPWTRLSQGAAARLETRRAI